MFNDTQIQTNIHIPFKLLTDIVHTNINKL